MCLRGVGWFVLLLGLASFVQAQPVTLVTLGDSLTEGDGDDGIGGGYPPRLLALLEAGHPGSTLDNVGVSGHTSDDLINIQLSPATGDLNAAPAGNIKMALVWIGSNDLFGLYAYVCDNDPYTPGEYTACESDTFGYYSANITNILSTLQGTGAQLFIALLDDQSRRPVMADPVLRAASYPEITDAEVLRMSTQVTNYNAEIASLASTYGATTVDFFNTTIFEDEATLSDDGNHPNGVGYDAIAAIWFQAVSGGGPVVPIFSDGFESGGTTHWSSSVP